jgi:hypothetical protein
MADYPVLNHAEMVFRPGDREAAQALFETMGFRVGELPAFDDSPWMVVFVDRDAPEDEIIVDNLMYANESTLAQQNLEAKVQEFLDSDAEFKRLHDRYQELRVERPQYNFHFGSSVPTREEWQARVDALKEANESHPLLKGRLQIDVREPFTDNPLALGGLSQLFLITDIISVGVYPFASLLFDLQWSPGAEVLLKTMPTADQYPDRKDLV